MSNISNKIISHLFNIDDLKFCGKDDNGLEILLRTGKAFNDDIGIEFGLDKCIKDIFLRGNLNTLHPIVLDAKIVIKELEQE